MLASGIGLTIVIMSNARRHRDPDRTIDSTDKGPGVPAALQSRLLRWKSPAQPTRHAQALAVEANAAAKVVGKL